MTALIIWGVLCFVGGYFVMDAMPCHWFGSSTEGACGYNAFYYYLITATGLTVLLSVATIVVINNRIERLKMEQPKLDNE